MNQKIIRLFILITTAVVMAREKTREETADLQIALFKERTPGPVAILTTAAGKPVEYNEARFSFNKNLISNEYFMDITIHFNRERIPERVVHAKGAGAFGYFEVTHDVTDICKAKLFSHIGKKTPIAVRFSALLVEPGGIDTPRQIRGFAVKFYTEDGNLDLPGLHTPMFQLKDPILFPSFIHGLKRNPATHLSDANMFWDVFTSNPESLHLLVFLFGDRGIPDGYRHMAGFPIHTYQVVNELGESFFVRFNFLPDEGIKNLFSEDAQRIGGEDPDYAIRDLYDAIAKGNYPSWSIYIQVLTLDDVINADFDVFDITRTLPENKYPLKPLGRIVLNKNPVNYFAEIEQLAYCPGNLVPGILGAPDKLFESRRLAYRDAQNYRLGGNFLKIPVNCPTNNKAYTYNRDGVSPVNDNEKDIPNYYPNSFNGPVPYLDNNSVDLIEIYEDLPNNLDQTRALYLSYPPEEKKRLVNNIVSTLKLTTKFLQERAVKLFGMIDPLFGQKVFEGLHGNATHYEL